MTANDNNNFESDNPCEEYSVSRKEALPLLALLRREGGWSTKEELVCDLGLRVAELKAYLDVLVECDEVNVHCIGRTTIVSLPAVDVREAVVELSDRRERRWRDKTDDKFPPIDDR